MDKSEYHLLKWELLELEHGQLTRNTFGPLLSHWTHKCVEYFSFIPCVSNSVGFDDYKSAQYFIILGCNKLLRVQRTLKTPVVK